MQLGSHTWWERERERERERELIFKQRKQTHQGKKQRLRMLKLYSCYKGIPWRRPHIKCRRECRQQSQGVKKNHRRCDWLHYESQAPDYISNVFVDCIYNCSSDNSNNNNNYNTSNLSRSSVDVKHFKTFFLLLFFPSKSSYMLIKFSKLFDVLSPINHMLSQHTEWTSSAQIVSYKLLNMKQTCVNTKWIVARR